jgi:hypothetical protein
MDVYHKVLGKVHELSGGKESVDVDLVALLKREGFYSNFDGIKEHLSGESWVTDSPKPNHVRITHWGVMEARKAGRAGADGDQVVAKLSNKLLAETREFNIVLEEFVGRPSADSFNLMKKKLDELHAIAEKIKPNV